MFLKTYCSSLMFLVGKRAMLLLITSEEVWPTVISVPCYTWTLYWRQASTWPEMQEKLHLMSDMEFLLLQSSYQMVEVNNFFPPLLPTPRRKKLSSFELSEHAHSTLFFFFYKWTLLRVQGQKKKHSTVSLQRSVSQTSRWHFNKPVFWKYSQFFCW